MIYADDINYWKTSQVAPDAWIDKAKAEIKVAGGKVLSEAFGSDGSGRAAFMVEFTFGDERYKAVWPVLQPRSQKDIRAARVQAATMMYHDIKAKCVAAKVLGVRAAFLPFLTLPDGRTAGQASTPDLMERFPKLLIAGD